METEAQTVLTLSRMWGREWEDLTPRQKNLVRVDFMFCNGPDRRDYQHNIGAGNLASYARTIEAAADRKDRR
jgi:hypothetical protein